MDKLRRRGRGTRICRSASGYSFLLLFCARFGTAQPVPLSPSENSSLSSLLPSTAVSCGFSAEIRPRTQ